MSTSASGPQDSGDTREPTHEAPPSRPAGDPDLLERVLQETAEIYSIDEPLSAADQTAMREVAGRHRGEPLTLDPIGVELVQAVLQSHFPAQPHESQLWHAMTAQIALTLFDDPVSHERLQAMWIRLGGGES